MITAVLLGALAYVLFAAALLVATWLVYLANMAILWSGSRPTGLSLPCARALQVLAAVMSVALNWLVFTLVLLEWPRERFLSTRLARHIRTDTSWRWRIAYWMGAVWLDPFDPNGTHIGATYHA